MITFTYPQSKYPFNNAYTNAYTLAEDLKAKSCRSMPSQPTHLHSSPALAPSASAIGLSDQRGPQVVELMTEKLCTRHLDISPEEFRLME